MREVKWLEKGERTRAEVLVDQLIVASTARQVGEDLIASAQGAIHPLVKRSQVREGRT